MKSENFFNMLGPSDIRKVQQLMLPKDDQIINPIIGCLTTVSLSSKPSKSIRSELLSEISSKSTHFMAITFHNFNVLNEIKFFLKCFISNLELIEKGTPSKKFNFQDCSLVNCIYAGAFIFYKRNIELASIEIERLFNLTGSVMPTSLENKKLVGMRRNGICYIPKQKL